MSPKRCTTKLQQRWLGCYCPRDGVTSRRNRRRLPHSLLNRFKMSLYSAMNVSTTASS